MAAARPILALVSLLMLAGGIVLSFFVILSGAGLGNPVNRVYFLQADVGGITGAAPNPARWTFLAICGVVNGYNGNCGHTVAALPFNPQGNFGTTTGVPPGLIGTSHYYYLSRFMFAFYIMALFFAVCAFFTGILALFTRIGSYLAGLLAGLAWFFMALAASLMTAWTVQGRKQFQAAGRAANLGAYGYGFTWAAFLCYLIAMVLFCVGGSMGRGMKDSSSYKKGQKKSFFGRKKSTASRGSFIDSESQRRVVKDEYP